MRPRGEVDTDLGERRARAAGLLLLALPGTQYLYQGEELGLPEVLDLPDHARQDPTWFRSGHNDPGRDGSRVPLPWTTRPGDFGFSATDEPTAAPWLPQPSWFAKYAVTEQIADATSTLAMYRHALRVRRTAFPGTDTTVTWLDVPDRPDVLAFRRSEVTCVVVFGTEPLPLPREWGEVLTASDALDGRTLPGGTAAWIRQPAR
jgi:alpha-glucosidase